MSQILVVVGHPNEAGFNHKIAHAAIAALRANDHEVIFHDLYREGFDPILEKEEIPRSAPLEPVIRRHSQEVAEADGIIVIHPNWWGQPPAILKGWVDRVFRPGVAYLFKEGEGGEGIPVGLLKARAALVFNTSNTAQERERRVFGDPLETIWKNCIFGLCGVEVFYRRTFSVFITSTPEQRDAWLAETREVVGRYFPPDGG